MYGSNSRHCCLLKLLLSGIIKTILCEPRNAINNIKYDVINIDVIQLIICYLFIKNSAFKRCLNALIIVIYYENNLTIEIYGHGVENVSVSFERSAKITNIEVRKIRSKS